MVLAAQQHCPIAPSLSADDLKMKQKNGKERAQEAQRSKVRRLLWMQGLVNDDGTFNIPANVPSPWSLLQHRPSSEQD